MPTPTHRQPVVAVFGSSTVRESERAWGDARDLGAALARRGLVTMTGGYDGVMAAASRGAHEAGGHVIGVTVELFERRGPVNPWVRERVHTPDLFERLRHIVYSADGFVAVAGSIGTLTEVFLVWTLVSVEGREAAPIVLMGPQWHDWLALHRGPDFVPERLHGFVEVAETPDLAAEAVAAGIARARGAAHPRAAGLARVNTPPTVPVSMDPLLAWRARFPSVETVLHFASHTLGAMPAEAEASLLEYTTAWGARSVRAWEERWMRVPADVSGAVEQLIQAEPGSISLHPNVTVAQAVALSCLEFTPARNRVVCTAEDFPSELYLYEGLERRGAEIVRVPARERRRIEEADLLAAIDERTALVAVSHVLFRTSQLLDLAPVLAKARAAGAISMVDAYQSVGVVDVDVRVLAPDLLTGGSIKWLCGGPGTGYLYVSPRVHARLHPALTGWFAHETPFAFESGPQRLHAGERRFWNGTPCIPAYLAARPGFTIAAEMGGEALREKSLRLTGRLLSLADEHGFTLGSPREAARRGGTVCLDVPNAERVCARLLAEDVLLDFRPGVGIRLAPHHYTRDDEVDEVMRRVRRAVDAER